jgi:hypothetical protein
MTSHFTLCVCVCVRARTRAEALGISTLLVIFLSSPGKYCDITMKYHLIVCFNAFRNYLLFRLSLSDTAFEKESLKRKQVTYNYLTAIYNIKLQYNMEEWRGRR